MKVIEEAGLIYFFNEKNKFDMVKWLRNKMNKDHFWASKEEEHELTAYEPFK
jgi:hypothetical protein